MKKHTPLILPLLVVFIFAPTLYDWVANPEGAWYRPFLIWILLIVIAYIIQGREETDGL